MKTTLETIKFAMTDERAFEQFAANKRLRYSVGAVLAAVAVGLGWLASTRSVFDTTVVLSLAMAVTLGMAAVFCFIEFTGPFLKVAGWIGVLILVGFVVIVTLGLSSLVPVSLAVIVGSLLIAVAIGRKGA